uniref:Nonstructural protein 1 n=1 Tax=Motacilla cinerea densovirus TaxID=2794499 RepID=A0A8A4XDE2_9VIRU|nr:MAG: nonstructural protein 1 [Motacilla cinerea densovirus]
MWKYACDLSLTSDPDIEQFNEFDIIFKINSICPKTFAKNLKDVLLKSDPKINCIRLIGTANSGKTLLANCICEPFITCYNNNHGSENEFYLSNMLNKSIILCEELYVTIATAEDMKSVLGGQNIDIAKKFDEKQLLSRTPVIITSNYARFGRGHLSPIDERALALRCHTFDFVMPYKPKCRLTSAQFYLYLLSNLY